MPVYFWVTLAAMTAAALAIALWPLWRGRRAHAAHRAALNRQIYRERLDELRQEQAAGRLDAAQAQALEQDLGRRVLAEGQTQAPAIPAHTEHKPWPVSLVLMLTIPALAFGVYGSQQSWQLAREDGPDMAYLVEMMADRVQASPDDIQAWVVLAQARESLEQYAQAADAYAEANARLEPAEPRFLIREAQLRALLAQGDLSGRPTELLEQALAQTPDHPQALWYAGLAAKRRGDNRSAMNYWQRLKKQEVPPEIADLLEQQLRGLNGAGRQR